MGREARIHGGELSLYRYTRRASRFVRQWPNELTPGAIVVMTDRIYAVLKNGSLFRLPVGTAKHVKAS